MRLISHSAAYIFIVIAYLCVTGPAVHAWTIVAGERNVGNYTYAWNPAVDYVQWEDDNPLSVSQRVVFEYSEEEAVYSFSTRAYFDACDFSNAKLLCGPTAGADKSCVVRVDVDAVYVSSVEAHCRAGHKLVIVAAPPPPASALRPSSVIKLPSLRNRRRVRPRLPVGNPIDFAVGGSSGLGPPPVVRPTASGSTPARTITAGTPTDAYDYPFNPAVNYATWQKNTKFYIGDVISFRYPMYAEEVVQFNSWAAYRACNYADATIVCYDVWGSFKRGCVVKVDNETAYYGSGMFSRCKAGVKFLVRPKAQPYVPRKVVVGEATADFPWPWNPVADMAAWSQSNKIYKGDILVFKYRSNADTVYQVPTLADYQACNYNNFVAFCGPTDGTGSGCESNPVTAVSYFLSGTFGHCKGGQRIIARPSVPPV